MLDEMTAALPADLTERVLHVIGNQRGSDRCIIFISHRLIEIAAVCDRATVLREGATVGVVDIDEGSEERIVALMLGDERAKPRRSGGAQAGERPPRPAATTPRLAARDLAWRPCCTDVSFDCVPARSSASPRSRARARTSCSTSSPGRAAPTRRRTPRPRRAGLVPASGGRHPGRPGLVPADRAEALLMQRSIRENVALPYLAGFRSWGPIDDVGRTDDGRRRRSPAPDRHARRIASCASCPAATSRR